MGVDAPAAGSGTRRVLVTGGSGMLGTELVSVLEGGFEVTVGATSRTSTYATRRTPSRSWSRRPRKSSSTARPTRTSTVPRATRCRVRRERARRRERRGRGPEGRRADRTDQHRLRLRRERASVPTPRTTTPARSAPTDARSSAGELRVIEHSADRAHCANGVAVRSRGPELRRDDAESGGFGRGPIEGRRRSGGGSHERPRPRPGHAGTDCGQGRGVVNATNAGSCSWFEFAREILDRAGQSGVPIEPVASDEFPRPAPRPGYSVLSLERLVSLTGREPRHWRDALSGIHR